MPEIPDKVNSVKRRRVLKNGALFAGVGVPNHRELEKLTFKSTGKTHLVEVGVRHEGFERATSQFNCGFLQYTIDKDKSELRLSKGAKEGVVSTLKNNRKSIRHPNGLIGGGKVSYQHDSNNIPIKLGQRPTTTQSIRAAELYTLPPINIVARNSEVATINIKGEKTEVPPQKRMS